MLDKPIDLFKAIFEDEDSSEEDSDADETPTTDPHVPKTSVQVSNGMLQSHQQPSASPVQNTTAKHQAPELAASVHMHVQQQSHHRAHEQVTQSHQSGAVQQHAAAAVQMLVPAGRQEAADVARLQAPSTLQQDTLSGEPQSGAAQLSVRQQSDDESESGSESDHRKAKRLKTDKSKHKHKRKHGKRHKDGKQKGMM